MSCTENPSLKPSEERVWEKWYSAGAAEQLKQEMPEGFLWTALIEPAIRKCGDKYDALVYFGNRIKRSELLAHVETWARMLRGMGLEADDKIILFAPLVPEAIYLLFAANKAGITVIMPNLGASHKALEGSVDNAKAAFVFNEMEPLLSDILAKPQFRHVVLISADRSMPAPLHAVVGTINWFKTRKIRGRSDKYMSVSQALSRYGNFQGSIDAAYRADRVAMVFSSGGTTAEGTAKLIGVSDKAMITMFRNALAFNLTGNPFREGTRSLDIVPPFVCTGFFALLLAPLFRGMTVHLEPRLDQKHFNEAMYKVRPHITLVSGSLWTGFFRDVEHRLAQGQKVDLSDFVLPIMGGEGCTPETLEWMDSLAAKAGAKIGIVSGYGMSEAFSVITVNYHPGQFFKRNGELAISVGYPFPGFIVGIFDKDGNELPYGQRGELRVKTQTMMSGYLNNPKLTEEIIGDGWIHSGDFAEMTPDGIVYLYGRMHEHIEAPDGQPVYLFDIANRLRQDKAVKESLVLRAGNYDNCNIMAHIILEEGCNETLLQVLTRLDNDLSQWLPKGVEVKGYQVHPWPFKVSLITKVNRAYYSRLLTGYSKPIDGKLQEVNLPN